MGMPTLLDIAKHNASDDVAGLIEESIQAIPEISGMVFGSPGERVNIPNVGAARTISGRQYKTLVRTALPSATFRNANEGTTAKKSTFENRLVETFIMEARFESDKAVADSHEDGAEAYIAVESSAILEANMRHVAKQFYYGTGSNGDSKGFPGVLAAVDSDLVVDAGGTTDNTASSVWAVKFGPQDARWVWGKQAQFEMSDLRVESLQDDSGNRFDAYVQTLLGYPGLQVGRKQAVGRIKKLTEDSGATLTDDLVYKLLSKFPSGIVPDVLFMTRRSQEQLRSSRTATNATGNPAPTPTEVAGIPIAVTDSILDTESLSL